MADWVRPALLLDPLGGRAPVEAPSDAEIAGAQRLLYPRQDAASTSFPPCYRVFRS
jgi:hypothetical protein